ncbi:glycerophosphodiester phosphodiesterase [Streptosporangium lutulentum]|uniref:Glycerophosphoryl diester phosphodiesterase n=1 Tax=Streptosporangium lutulentum TaxID=1461250 RepID=A0ABT9Q9D3_9ACTN|nr:glycerophosphodiester phosphodiesterase [Streptosporangium lutulentum]MDP9842559.1 glycerophosphoryl diester phosphodiesterase [Streptosporangium lutulentum]
MRRTAKISLLSVLAVGGTGEAHGVALPDPSRCSTPGIVSHRGYWVKGVENTVKALDQALDAGSEQVEFDVHFTRDHHPVLMHDALVDRTTTGTGRISGMTLAQFRRLRTTDGQRPPTLSEAFTLARGRAEEVLVELKAVPDAQDLRSLKRDYHRFDAYRWASLMSFSLPALKAVTSVPARKGLLTTTAPPLTLARKFSFAGVRYDRLTRELTREYLDHGVAVYAWTPDDPSTWERLASYGVDRVITNETSAYLAWSREACEP